MTAVMKFETLSWVFNSESDRMRCNTSDNNCQDIQNWRHCFVGNVIMCLMSHSTIIFSSRIRISYWQIFKLQIKAMNKNTSEIYHQMGIFRSVIYINITRYAICLPYHVWIYYFLRSLRFQPKTEYITSPDSNV